MSTPTPETPIQVDPNCQSDFDIDSLSCDEALERILAAVVPIQDILRVPIREALGRVLAQAVKSRFDVPPHRNSAMDGYAVRSADLPAGGTVELSVVGSAFAGRPYTGRVGDREAVRIMTGAVMPDDCDTVIMQEHTEVPPGDDAAVRIDDRHRRGQNTREAGEDIQAGATVLSPGRSITPADLGLLASLGIGEVDVLRRPRVAFVSTGDELRSLGEPLGPGDIYDSNRYTLHGMLKRIDMEIVDLGVVRDEPDAVRRALLSGAANADVVITSGGVSVGEADYIREILAEIGEVRFWKVAMKPGRPLALGRIGDAMFFGLPGNPVSVMVTFYQFVQPALFKLAGAIEPPRTTRQAVAAGELRKRPGRTEYQRGRCYADDDGTLSVESVGDQGSGILSSMSVANCFIVLPMDASRVAPGETVTVQLFSGLM